MSGTPVTVTPAPAHGEVIVGRDTTGRVLRVSSHPEADRVVLSVWQGPRCVATVRLSSGDVPALVRALTAMVADDPPTG
jgi:hypothetical protein